jgi:catechol 2,3-dioxygenase-like lactoylglutathione lyase family enzyme
MKLIFVYQPVADMKQALSLYRDTLGWEEAWREGETTTALQLPGSEVQLMLDLDDGSGKAAPGPVFEVDSVREFQAARRDQLRFRQEPNEIPGGFWGAFEDPSGNVVYLLDQSTGGGGG